VTDPASGYGYHYRKSLQLVEGQPRMILQHALRNTGRKPIRGEVYDHNFLVLDNLPPGPDFVVRLPFAVKAKGGQGHENAEIRGNEIRYRKVLAGKDTVAMDLEGFGQSRNDYDIRVENRSVGAGYRVTANKPLSRLGLWSIRTTLCMEPFIRTGRAAGARVHLALPVRLLHTLPHLR